MILSPRRGGTLALLLLSACGARSDLSTQASTSTPSAPRCLLFGGFPSVAGGADDDTWIWDGKAWSAVSTTPPDANTGTLVTFGGGPVLFPSPPTSLNTTLPVWRYDEGTWTALSTAPAPAGRFGAAVAVSDGGVVLFGGLANDGSYTPLGDTWVWDGSTWTQKTPAASPPPRWFAAAAGLKGQVVLFGGTDAMGALGDTWVWDGSTWTEASTATAPSPRVGARATGIGGRVLLFGGCAAGGVTGCEFTGTEVDDTWLWDGSTWTEASPATSPPARDDAALATLGAEAVLFGGFAGANEQTSLSDTWIWDGSTWNERAVKGPAARGEATMNCW